MNLNETHALLHVIYRCGRRLGLNRFIPLSMPTSKVPNTAFTVSLIPFCTFSCDSSLNGANTWSMTVHCGNGRPIPTRKRGKFSVPIWEIKDLIPLCPPELPLVEFAICLPVNPYHHKYNTHQMDRSCSIALMDL